MLRARWNVDAGNTQEMRGCKGVCIALKEKQWCGKYVKNCYFYWVKMMVKGD